jgi:glycosyltransferase involved in cell wall biosynthesis
MRLVLCTYHKQDDAAVLEKMLRSRGFQTGFSKRYMIYPGDKEIAAPYLRRGLIRAQKTGNPLELDENCQTPTPEYSIVLPVFKTKYFKEAFDSVAKQSFGDYEIVVMNDEADGDITWVKENPRVRYFENHPRLGPTQNWNRGLCFCRGKFVLVFSDDDILEPNFLEEVDKFLREHNFEMDVVRVLRADVNEAGEIQLFSAPGRPVESLSEFFYNQYFFNRIHALQDFVFCRETALAIGGFKNFPRGMYSDLLFLVEIAAGKDKVGNLNKLLVRFRIHGMNLSRFKDKNFYFDMLSSAFGFYSGVRVALRNSLGVYQKFVGQVNESFLQKNTYSCYSGMILNYGVRALWRLHCKAPDGVDKIQSLSRAISWYFYYRFKKVLFYPKQLFLRKMR